MMDNGQNLNESAEKLYQQHTVGESKYATERAHANMYTGPAKWPYEAKSPPKTVMSVIGSHSSSKMKKKKNLDSPDEQRHKLEQEEAKYNLVIKKFANASQNSGNDTNNHILNPIGTINS